MSRTAPKVVGVLLAVVGLVLTGAGSWFAAHLGSSGTATFTTRPRSAQPIVMDPSVLNRVDGAVRITVTPAAGATAWIGVAAPSDAAAVIGGAGRTSVTGVSASDWTLRTRPTGSGPLPDVAHAEVWQRQAVGSGTVSLTVQQSAAPQTVLVTVSNGTIATLTMAWTRKAWFVQAVVAVLIGLALLAGGTLLLWPRTTRDLGSISSSSGTSRMGVAA